MKSEISVMDKGKNGIQTQCSFTRDEETPQTTQIAPENRRRVQENFSSSTFADSSPKRPTKSYPLDPRLRRIRANSRERRRIQAINDAMEALRKVIPNTESRRKLTKLELLRLAQEYIRDLSEILCADRQNLGEQVINVDLPYPHYSDFFVDSFYTS